MCDSQIDPIQREMLDFYAGELAALGEAGTAEQLERSQDFELGDVLRDGGALVFAHLTPRDCGYQAAACVRACLDSGARSVLALSVLHVKNSEMRAMRERVRAGGDPRSEPLWGIHGPGCNGSELWRYDHAMMSWRHFWEAELARRGIARDDAPTVVERYPFIVGEHPELLPGIEDLQRLAERSAIVVTIDPFHHGIGYQTNPGEAFYPDGTGLAAARAAVEEGISLLSAGDYEHYNRHCAEVKSDGADVGVLLHHLRRPISGRVLDLTYSDTTALYHAPEPTWVAAALIEWRPEAV